MIANFNNDEAMAKYGREVSRYKAIAKCKENLRDCIVRLNNYHTDDFEVYNKESVEIKEYLVELDELLKLEIL